MPPGHAAEHDLDRQPEPRQTDRTPLRAVAVRAGAVEDEQRPGRMAGKARADELRVRDVAGTGHVGLGEELWAAHVDEHEVRALGERVVHVPAVGLKAQRALEVARGHSRCRLRAPG